MSQISDLLQPEWGYLLIQKDPESEIIGMGLDGNPLVAPEGYRDRSRPSTGIVLKAGPGAPYPPGIWVVFDSHSGTDLALGGDRDKILLESSQVLAWVAKEDIEELREIESLGADQEPTVAVLNASPGFMLVERAEMPIHRGRIIIPDGVNVHTRSSEAEVIAVGTQESPYKEGDNVFLAGSVSKSFNCGPGFARRFWRCTPQQIPARILQEPAEPIVAENNPLAGMKELRQQVDHDRAWDEGDPRAVR